MSKRADFIAALYRRFNTRDMEAVLVMMSDDVEWANGMEGGYVHGRDGVRDYWTRQWAMIDPHVEPLSVTDEPDGSLVEVHQVVCDLDGKVLADQVVFHRFEIEGDMIRRFDIVGRSPVIPSA
jgi:ketosteroid isomerase-like protein